MIVTDPVFWLSASLAAALVGFTHYLMKHYHLCITGWRRVGRYIVGILIIACGFAGWWAVHPEASGPEIVGAIALLIVVTGLTTILAYGADNTVDRERCHKDLSERGLGVED
jgi:hypothetical protein